jgi:hypothetical protein
MDTMNHNSIWKMHALRGMPNCGHRTSHMGETRYVYYPHRALG